MHRYLGLSERFTWMMDQTSPVNVVLAARVAGTLTEAQLMQALAAIQHRHPLLQTKIAIDAEGRPYFAPAPAPIPLQVLPWEETAWAAIAQAELCQPVAWQTAPLIRLTALPTAEMTDLILTFHHVIGDGLSGVYFLQEVLAAVTQPGPRPSLPLLPACEALYPYCRLSLVDPDAEAPPTAGASLPTTPSDRWVPQVLYWSLSAAETMALVQRCRQEQTTVHGALSAAFLQAIAADIETQPDTQTQSGIWLKCLSMINLRPYLVPPVGAAFGAYVSAGATYHAWQAPTSPWAVARAVKHQLNQHIQRGQLFAGIPESLDFWAAQPDVATIYSIAESLVATDLAITNLGNLDELLPMTHIPLQHLFLMTPGLKTQLFMVAIATVQEQMFVSVRYPAPVIAQVCAERVSDRARDNVLALINARFQ